MLPATITVSTLLRSINVTTAPGTLLSGATLMASRSQQDDVGLLARSQRADLVGEPGHPGPSTVARRMTSRHERSSGRSVSPASARSLMSARWKREDGPHLGEEVRGHGALDVGAERGLDAMIERGLDRRHAVPHGHLDRGRDRDLRPRIGDRLPGGLRDGAGVDELEIRPHQALALDLLDERPLADAADEVRHDGQAVLAPDRPGFAPRGSTTSPPMARVRAGRSRRGTGSGSDRDRSGRCCRGRRPASTRRALGGPIPAAHG